MITTNNVPNGRVGVPYGVFTRLNVANGGICDPCDLFMFPMVWLEYLLYPLMYPMVGYVTLVISANIVSPLMSLMVE